MAGNAFDWPAWSLWALVNGLLLIPLAGRVRWVAVAAMALSVGLLVRYHLEYGPSATIHTLARLVVQIVVVALLMSPARIARATGLVGRRWQWVCAAIAAAIGYLHPVWGYPPEHGALLLSVLVHVVAGVWGGLRSPVGRALVPARTSLRRDR
jgi:hypothetical protein